MTEAEWNACTYPPNLLAFMRHGASERKLWLFEVACCRRVWHLLNDERCRAAVEMAERFAEGQASREEVAAVATAASHAISQADSSAFYYAKLSTVLEVDHWLYYLPDYPGQTAVKARGFEHSSSLRFDANAGDDEEAAQAGLIRCIFGNPFRPSALKPAWRTLIVKQLAESIYEERAFYRMPILGDALEESGCGNVEILNHCRQPGEHARGCGVLDKVLRKK